MTKNFVLAIEASPDDFIRLDKSGLSDAQLIYVDGLEHYLLGRTDELSYILAHISEASEEFRLVQNLLNARLSLRLQKDLNVDLLVENLLLTEEDAWRGEINFVLGLNAERCQQFLEARAYFLKAASHYKRVQAFRKMAKCRFNAVTNESQAFRRNQSIVINYLSVAKDCRRVREFGMAGMALVNVAAVYHETGALQIALKYVQRGLAYLNRDFGTRHYFLALLQRAEIFIDLNRQQEASLDVEECAIAPFPEIQEASKFIFNKLSGLTRAEPNPAKMVATWQQKLSEPNSPMRLGSLEQRVLELLSKKPRTRHEFIVELYGTESDYASLENRLSVLLNRVKRKVPGAIVLEGKTYRLVNSVKDVVKKC